jgi:opacity protein-like surface antigen
MRSLWNVRIACTALALGAAGALATPAHAQYVAELTPFFTSYYPLANVADFDVGGGVTVSERQFAAPGGGARLTFWVSPTIGIEAAGSYVASGTKLTSSDATINAGVSLGGTLMTANGRLVYRPARTNLYLLVGAGIVKRGGDTWDSTVTNVNTNSLTNFGGVVGLGARANVTPKFALNFTVEANLYQSDPDGADGTAYEKKFQSDIYVSIGVPIGFGRR